VKQVLQRYKDLQDIIAILGIDELSEDDKLPCPGRAKSSVPLAAVHVAEQFTGSRASTCRSRHHPRLPGDRHGKHDALPEQAFYMVDHRRAVERRRR